MERKEHLSHLPTLLSKTARFQLETAEPGLPGLPHGRRAGSAQQSPQGSGAGFQDGTGMLLPVLPAQVGSGLPVGSGTSTQHCTHTCSETPPAPSLPFSWAYTAPLQKSKLAFV